MTTTLPLAETVNMLLPPNPPGRFKGLQHNFRDTYSEVFRCEYAMSTWNITRYNSDPLDHDVPDVERQLITPLCRAYWGHRWNLQLGLFVSSR